MNLFDYTTDTDIYPLTTSRDTIIVALTDEVRVHGVDGVPAQLGLLGVCRLELPVQHHLEVGGLDLLVEILEVHVVVDEDAALAEGLDLDAVERVADQGIAVDLAQLLDENSLS